MNEQFKIKRKSLTKNPIFEFHNKITIRDLMDLVNKIESEIFIEKSWKKQFIHKAYFVMTELLSNAFRHGVSEKEISLTINIIEDKLMYLCENYIYTDLCEKTAKKIDPLNLLSGNRNELMALFKSKLSSGGFSKCRTSGLGLIEIIRRTDEKLVYNFEKKEEGLSVFSIITIMNIKFPPLSITD